MKIISQYWPDFAIIFLILGKDTELGHSLKNDRMLLTVISNTEVWQ